MGLLDFLFGNNEHTSHAYENRNRNYDYGNEFSDDEYYNYHFDNALAGDPESIREMKETFGEDWFE